MAVTDLKGNQLILFFRKLADAQTDDASRLRFQTEHSIELSKNTSSTTTKDGNLTTVADGESKVAIKSIAFYDDQETVSLWEELEQWYEDNEVVELWEVNLATEDGGSYKARYWQGYFTEFKINAPADGNVTLETTFAINGRGQRGVDTLTEAQQDAIKGVMYEYQKLEKLGV